MAARAKVQHGVTEPVADNSCPRTGIDKTTGQRAEPIAGADPPAVATKTWRLEGFTARPHVSTSSFSISSSAYIYIQMLGI